MTLAMPLSWTICHRQLGHAMINILTKFEVSTFSRYGDMKCVKMNKMGVVWGGYGSPKVIDNVTIR